jgi:hypothetical protein
MSGVVSREDLNELMGKMGEVCATYAGAKFAMIADMRDLQPLAPEAADMLGRGIEMGRKNGIAVCAHLSNSGIIRLQANRVSREAAAGDASVFDVVSLEEAWRLIDERNAMPLSA